MIDGGFMGWGTQRRFRDVVRGLLVLALLPVTGAIAQYQAPQPPVQWAGYLSAARKAEETTDLEQRCLVYPDLPGNQWPEGPAKARCALLRKPMLSLEEMSAMLAHPGGAAALDQRYAALLDAHYASQAQREQIFIGIQVFDKTDRALRVAKRWLDALPDSAYAKLALGHQYSEQGWAARGEKLARETSKAQLSRMEQHFTAAVPLLLEALKQEPRLSPACTALAAIGRMSSDQLQQAAMGACLEADPNSYHVVLEWVYAAQPKWGGSAEQLRAVVAFAAARVGKNPMLGALLAMGAGYEADMTDDWAEALPGLVVAARMAPDGRFLGKAGRGYASQRDAWASVTYLSQAIRFRPNDEDTRYRRAVELNRLGEHTWALPDAEAAVRIDPENGWHHYELGRVNRFLGLKQDGRADFRRAMDDFDVREAAYPMWCQTFSSRRETGQALSCSAGLTQEYPNESDGWRLRASALGAAGDIAVYDAIERFLATMDVEANPHQAGWAADFREFVVEMPRARFVPGKTRLNMEPL